MMAAALKCLLSTRLSFTYDNIENFLKGRFHAAWLYDLKQKIKGCQSFNSRRGWVKVYWYSDGRSIQFSFDRQKRRLSKVFYEHRSSSVFLTNILIYRLNHQLVWEWPLMIPLSWFILIGYFSLANALPFSAHILRQWSTRGMSISQSHWLGEPRANRLD